MNPHGANLELRRRDRWRAIGDARVSVYIPLPWNKEMAATGITIYKPFSGAGGADSCTPDDSILMNFNLQDPVGGRRPSTRILAAGADADSGGSGGGSGRRDGDGGSGRRRRPGGGSGRRVLTWEAGQVGP
jgi:hypothetical protein